MSHEKDSDEALIKATKATLDDSVNQIDEEVRTRLRELRREALDAAQLRQQQHQQQHQDKQASGYSWLLPAGGFALLVLTIGVLSTTIDQSEEDQPAIADVEDLQLLTAPENLELYEDLDFYQWLAEHNEGLG